MKNVFKGLLLVLMGFAVSVNADTAFTAKSGKVINYSGLAVRATQFQDGSGNLLTNITAGTTTDNAVARFDGTNGDLQNSAVTIDDTTGRVNFTNASGTLVFKSGSNGSLGTFTVSGTQAVGVSNTSYVSSDIVVMSLRTAAGVINGQPTIISTSASGGFIVSATANNSSTYAYALIKTN